ncbi:MAG: 4Fe-4S ferredoxin [Actinobacteria bacterium]|jgi:ferredoxin|nr:MAG: 4Fe-4S ferredoxin [Actinomycetota bacterium]
MSSPVWFVNIIKKTFPQRFIMAWMTRLPFIGRGIEYLLFEGDDIIYLPKDQTVMVNEGVEAEDIVLPSQLVEGFIEKANYLWIMDTCICRDASNCVDYPIDLGCLFMGEAAMDINPKLGRQVSREEALEHVRRCREAGLFQLIGRNKLDTMWLNVRPGTRLLTVCNCCPCCCLWKILPVLSPKVSDKVHRMPGVKITVTEKCVACGTCEKDVCIARAIHVEGGRAVIGDACRGCGHCVEICPEGAIELSIDDLSFMDSLIPRISSLVDVT